MADERFQKWSWTDYTAWNSGRSREATKEHHQNLELDVLFEAEVERIQKSAEKEATSARKSAGGVSVKGVGGARASESAADERRREGEVDCPPAATSPNPPAESEERTKLDESCAKATDEFLREQGFI